MSKSSKPAKSAKPAKPGKPVPAIPLSRDGAALAKLRADGATWNEIGTLVSGDADKPASAIPLRVVLRRYLAENDAANAVAAKAGKESIDPLAATAEAVVEARDARGEGFPRIAARTGLSVPDVRRLYAEGGGESANGRIYVGASGRTLVTASGSVPLDGEAAKAVAPTKAERKAAKVAKRARKAAKAAKRAAKAA